MNSKLPRIAIVDDEVSVRKAVERLLRSAGMDVATFSSGTAFIDALSVNPVDCLVLDLHMAGLSGFDVQERLMRMGKWLPIIVMTGHDTPDSRARVLAGGAVEYLLKPIDDQVLIAAIEAAIANKRSVN